MRITAPKDFNPKNNRDIPLPMDVTLERDTEALSLGSQKIAKLMINGNHFATVILDSKGHARLRIEAPEVDYLITNHAVALQPVLEGDLTYFEVVGNSPAPEER